MPPTRAFYSVVQYVPDAGRGEAANTGVVLFVPSEQWVDVRVSHSLDRARRFFRPGRQELERIRLALEALQHRMGLAREEFKAEDDLAKFAAARADEIQLTPPRLIMVENPTRELEAIYAELVGEPQSETTMQDERRPAIPTALAEVLARLEIRNKVWRLNRIKIPTVDRDFEVSYAFQNGRVNYIRPESLARKDRLESRLTKIGFAGQLIYKHEVDNKASQLVVVSSDPNPNAESERQFAETLRDFNVQFVPHHEVDDFAHTIEQSAH